MQLCKPCGTRLGGELMPDSLFVLGMCEACRQDTSVTEVHNPEIAAMLIDIQAESYTNGRDAMPVFTDEYPIPHRKEGDRRLKPLKTKQQLRYGPSRTEVLKAMKVGQSFLDTSDISHPQASWTNAGSRAGIKIVTQREDYGIRVWRVT